MKRWLARLALVAAVPLLQIALTLATGGAFRPLLAHVAPPSDVPNPAGAAHQGTRVVDAVPQISDDASHIAFVVLAFPSFAALRAFNPASLSGETIVATTAGYANAGDGGASTYDWDAGSTRPSDNIFFVKPAAVAKGRWVLRLPDGSIHPEQAGARCDGVTDDAAALNALSNAINNSRQTVSNGVRIALNPNKLCLVAGASWVTPNGSTVSGTINPLDNAQGAAFDPFRSGFIHAPNVLLEVGQGGKLRDMVILRQNLPMNPQTFQTVMSQVMTWYGENGAISHVAPQGGSSGRGCKVGDKLVVQGGTGNYAWIQATAVSAAGAATRFTLLDPGAYIRFPSSPASTGAAFAASKAYACSATPTVTFTSETPRSVGVVMLGSSALENVNAIGFNVGVASILGGTRMDHVSFDDANGIDVTNNHANGVYRDLNGGELWASSLPHRSGVVSVTGVAAGGRLNRVGDVLTVRSGTCVMPPQITVDQVAAGAITSAHVSRYGNCSAAPRKNPSAVQNLHEGTPAAIDLLWAYGDYRPGTGVYAHDGCDGCQFSDVNGHGWSVGFDVSNVAFLDVFNMVLEPGIDPAVPPPPPMTLIGLRTRNCVQAMFYGLDANGFQSGAELTQTGGAHATLGSCGASAAETALNMGVSLSGGMIGSPTEGTSYAIDVGPFSRGMVSDVQINTAGIAIPVNVQAHVYGWAFHNIMPYGAGTRNWIRIDPTSADKVFANAVPAGGGTTSPLVVMGGLPTSNAGLPPGSVWNNRGVLNIVP